LSANGKVCGFSEEIFCVINFAGLGNFIEIQIGDTEHFTGTFCIATGNDGRVQVIESLVVEEFMNGKSQVVTNAEYGAERIGAEAQVCFLTQKLQ